MWIALAWLAACGPPNTGPSRAVGVLLDPKGDPVAGQKMVTVESSDVTDAQGRFDAPWKAPSQHVDTTWRGARYLRARKAQDDGYVMTLKLPHTRDLTLRCERHAACDLQLRWELGDGLQAVAHPECPEGKEVVVQGVPAGTPTAWCASAPGAKPDQVPLGADGAALVLEDDLAPVTVELRTEGTPPDDCQVWVGDTPATQAADGSWQRVAAGRVEVRALCGGRPATPRTVRVRGPQTVALEWSRVGPEVDLGPWLSGWNPALNTLTLTRLGDDGWATPLPPPDRAVFALPPLPAGDYTLTAGTPSGPPKGFGEPGVVHVRRVDQDQGTVRDLEAVLRLKEDALDDKLPVRAP